MNKNDPRDPWAFRDRWTIPAQSDYADLWIVVTFVFAIALIAVVLVAICSVRVRSVATIAIGSNDVCEFNRRYRRRRILSRSADNPTHMIVITDNYAEMVDKEPIILTLHIRLKLLFMKRNRQDRQ
jgi:hypothetical protein